MFRCRPRFALTTCATKYLVNFYGLLPVVDSFAPQALRRAAEIPTICVSSTGAGRQQHRGLRTNRTSINSTKKVIFCATMDAAGGEGGAGGYGKVCKSRGDGEVLLL